MLVQQCDLMIVPETSTYDRNSNPKKNHVIPLKKLPIAVDQQNETEIN